MTWTAHLENADATRALGRRVGETAQPGWVLSLEGPLGSGKTTFAQGVAEGLGVAERLTSPTFVLETRYQGRLPLHHFDLYRLGELPTLAELIEIGLLDALQDNGVCLIEWADRLPEDVLPHCLRIVLAHAATGRDVTVLSQDEDYAGLVKELAR